MRFAWLAGVVMGALLALSSAIALPPSTASACRLVDVGGGARGARVRFAAEVMKEAGGQGTLVIVGEVTSEIRVDFVRGSTPLERNYVRNDELTKGDQTNAYYRSQVKPLAVLYGDWQGGRIEMFLQPQPECFGGPRLKEGERVLLFLAPTLIAYSPQGEQWELQPVPIGGKVVIRDGQAFLNDLYRPGQYEPLGDADTIIREVAAKLGTPSRSESLALAAAGSDGDDSAGFVLIAALGGIVLAVSLGAAVVSLRR